MNMALEIIKIFWFFLPAAFANMAPVLFRWVPLLNVPIDLGRTLHGNPIFGPHKTYRGFLFGIITAILIVIVQKTLFPFMEQYGLVNYATVNTFFLGLLLGIGALFGDLVKSFFKRRFDIESGTSWVPFDQIDWIVGAIIFVNFYIWLGWEINVLALVLFGLLHPLVNYIGYSLHIKRKP